MKIRILTTVSALAMMAATLPAQAADDYSYDAGRTTVYSETYVRTDNNPATPDVEHVTEGDIERGWERTKEVVADTVETTGDVAENTYYSVRDTLAGDPFLASSVQVSQRNTAQGMIGKNTYTPEGETVATVEDIIVDRQGNAEKIVLRDGGFLGMGGSLVSMEYDQLVRPSPAGDMLQPIQRSTLDRSQAYAYKSRVQTGAAPVEELSIAAILDGNLLDARNQKVAEIDNVTFKNGNVDYLIVSYNEVLGMGGEQAAIKFSDLQPYRTDGRVDFRLSASQSQDFNDYRNMTRTR